jgi:DNA polymerase
MNVQVHEFAAASTVHHVLHRDYETRGVLQLQNVGAWKYASDDRTEILCCAFCGDDEPVKLWLPGDPVPPEFLEAANNPDWIVCAHNAGFELAIEHLIMRRRHGWPKIPLSRNRCTMAMALALALPPKLELLAQALELVHQKDATGQRLMLMMAKPRRARKDEDPEGRYWFEDQDRLERLYKYAKRDVEVEREAYQRLRPLIAEEQQLWFLDQHINARGFHLDRPFAEAARAIAQAASPEINAELTELTAGAVTSVHQTARLRAWLAAQDCSTNSIDKKAIEQLLATELAPPVRQALELRRDGAQAAVKKIDRLLAHCASDGRIRGCLRYHGASTGRWSGSAAQPQNLKRPLTEDLDVAAAAIATADYQHVKSLYPKPLSVIGDLTRLMVCAAPGRQLIGADFSSIESRVLAWVAGEEWKIESYRRFDATQDPRDEPYCITACRIFCAPDGSFDKDSPERQIGKTCDLAFGFMGGLAAWRKFEPNRFTDEEVLQFRDEWRAAHPQIKRFWREIDIAAWQAVRQRERVIRCGRILLKCEGMFLFIKLPSGRKLAYPYPRIVTKDAQHEIVVFKDASSGQWRDCRNGDGAYGGTWTENIVSAISRDLLAGALQRIERSGYRVVLHVHDEVIAEVPIGFGSTDEFALLMTISPSWAEGMPIAAKAWSGPRFNKS